MHIDNKSKLASLAAHFLLCLSAKLRKQPTSSLHTRLCHLPEASLEYWCERKELLSLEIAVGMSGCDTVLSRLPLVRPHRSQRDLRSPSTTVPKIKCDINKLCIMHLGEHNSFYFTQIGSIYLLIHLTLGWTSSLETLLRPHC